MNNHQYENILFDYCDDLIRRSDPTIVIAHSSLKRKIRDERLRLQMSVATAAKIAGVSVSSWRNYEIGKNYPRAKSLSRILEAGFNLAPFLPLATTGQTIDVSTVLRAERLRLGLTQNAISKLLGISISTWERYENGFAIPSTQLLIKMQKFGMNLGDPLSGSLAGTASRSIHPTEELLLKTFSLLDEPGRLLFCELIDTETQSM